MLTIVEHRSWSSTEVDLTGNPVKGLSLLAKVVSSMKRSRSWQKPGVVRDFDGTTRDPPAPFLPNLWQLRKRYAIYAL